MKTGQGGKGVLKDIGRTLLPAEVVDRPKGYFPVPPLVHLDHEAVGLLPGRPARRRRPGTGACSGPSTSRPS